MSDRTGRIGKFEIIEPLGEGGMGEVFLARDTIIGREVALKVIRRNAFPGPDGQARLFREIQAAGRLNHPNLVTIHEFGEKSGVIFLVMDHVAGDDLGSLVRNHALTPVELLDLLAQVCDGLAHIHQHGLVHHNLKPSNIRLGRVAGRPAAKVLDFGLSRAQGDPAALAAHLASLEHTAPEVLQGRYDSRADLFSVGVLLQEALGGAGPFTGADAQAITQRILQEAPAALDLDRLRGISPAIQTVLNQALAKDPLQRIASAEALAAALRAARNPEWTPRTEPVADAHPDLLLPIAASTHPGHPARATRKRVWPWALAALVPLGAAGAYGFRSWQGSRRAHLVAAPAPQPAPALPPPAAPAPAPAPAAEANAPGTAPAPAAAPAPGQANPAPPAPAPAPAPAPMAAAVKPPSQAPVPPGRSPYSSLDQASAAVDQDPQGALAFLEPAVASDPSNERATAMRMVALYNLGRYGECSRAIREAREAGHPLWPMALRQPPLRKMLERDALEPHLPRRKAPAPEPAP
jgi:serine/threonine-protein kinase